MIGTPVLLTGPPDFQVRHMDALQDILRTMRLSGAIFLEADFTAPWCVTSKLTPEDCKPFMPEPNQLIAYHYVTAGRLVVETEGMPAVTVAAGEVILLPRNDEHVIGSGENLKPISADGLIQPANDGGLARIVHGGGGERTQILCGFLGTNAPKTPVCDLLPKMLTISFEQQVGRWIESSVRLAAGRMCQAGPQSPALLGRLAELLFIEAVSRYVAALPQETSGWLAGLRDPIIGRALALLHGPMTHRWTTEELAREVGLSRSAFAERFTSLIGEPPMRYLAHWRLQAAAQRLTNSHEPIARIAFEAGYDSEAAFNRAFKRMFSLPPSGFRQQHGAARPPLDL